MKATRIKPKSFRSVTTATGGILLSSILTLSAQTWLPMTSGTYDWANGENWVGGTYANGPGATANINTDLSAAQTVRLNQNITLGVLNLGDALASGTSFGFNIGKVGSETLTFNSGTPGTAAQINLSSTGTPVNTISANVSLQSDLVVRLGGTDTSNAQRITFSGALDLGTDLEAKTLTFKEGVYNASNQITISGTDSLKGNGTIINDSSSVMSLSAKQTAFTGTVIVNNRATGSNAGSLTMIGSSLLNAKEFVINGYLSGANIQMGGSVQVGNNAGTSTNPGQRLTQNTITMNGGNLQNGGQNLNVGATGGQVVSDTVATLNFNSATSLITITNRSNTTTEMHVAAVQRSKGASALLQSDTLGGDSKIYVTNAASHQVGAGGAAGTTTMSAIPWMVTTNGYSFVTSTSETGVRSLSTTTEYASSISAGAGNNISTNSTDGLAEDATVNLFRFNSGSTLNIGTGRALTVAGGGVVFVLDKGQIGGAGSATAGTLNFGTAEGVVWAVSTHTNRIGAKITGSGGLSKAGPGTLILTGQNEYNGLTYVASGTLQVGDGTNAGNLGLSQEVTVASGAILKLKNADAFADDVVITLENFGLFNGKVDLEENQTVDKLIFGEVYQIAGTYGALGSGAMFENNQWFLGTGILTVNTIPEPSTYLFLGAGAGLMLWMRRNRSVRNRG